MPSIQLLDKSTINKIAAGEVVERPVSIVKELVENSIDAKATAITIEIKEGGLKHIRITDNGTGISKDDVDNAFIRHSTSKIHNINDLQHLMSLGFRGEALASIASVSMVEVITKTKDELTGVRAVFEDGVKKVFEEVGCPEGTTMIIKNLFYNVPARKKFLKSSGTEGSYISDLVNRLALSHEDISFKFVNNGSVKLHTTGNNNLKDCIMNVFGKEIAKNVLELNTKQEDYALEGFIGRPSISRGNRTYETYFINNRYVKSKIIQKAIEDAFKERHTLHQYPFTVFNLKIDASTVDVNVHPTKMEVRFDDEKGIYSFIYNAIKEVLTTTELIHEVSFSNERVKALKKEIKAPEPFEVNRRNELEGRNTLDHRKSSAFGDSNKSSSSVQNNKIREDNTEFKYGSKKHNEINSSDIIKNTNSKTENHDTSSKGISLINTQKESSDTTINLSKPINNHIPNDKVENMTYNKDKDLIEDLGQMNLESELFIDEKNVVHHKVIGQLFSTYWIVELKDKYYIIDQHAAHEKVLYEKIIKSLDEKVQFQQEVLYPTVVQLNSSEMITYKNHASVFTRLGFEIEEFGEDSVVIRSLPFIFNKSINDSTFLQILDGLNEEVNPNQYDALLHDIATMACKAAIKANDKMTHIEYEALLNDLLKLDNPFNCPHGRPTIISMTKYELEKKFKRIL